MGSNVGELCVIGYPSRLGGADTELDHQIHCWQRMGLRVHLCPTAQLDDNLRALDMPGRGCVVHDPLDWPSLDGLHCISFCNGTFLNHLPEIRRFARTTTFVNCMTWNFPLEVQRQAEGLIDFHLYQTDHAMDLVSAGLKEFSTFRSLRIQPYFHAQDFPFVESRPMDKFRFGRISRGDADKHGAAQFWIYETMTAPVLKEGCVLGWDHRSASKFQGPPPEFVRTYSEGAMTQRAFYEYCQAVIMTTDTTENLPRTGLEAMSSGSLLVVDRRGGWNILVEDGVTGWLCRDHREFVYKASRCAYETEETDRMRRLARQKLDRMYGFESSALSWSQVFGEWSRLR